MPYYRQVGTIPPKRHTRHGTPEGFAYAEELMGQEGFASRSALLYHVHSPSAITAIEPVDPHGSPLSPDLPLTPRHIRTGDLPAVGTDLVQGRTDLLGNADLTISWASATETGPLYRNAEGDELVFVQRGRATLQSVFGELPVGPGDYVVVPASTTQRWVIDEGPVDTLVLAATGHVSPPRRYLSSAGQFLEHAPYCERDLRAPDTPLLVEGEEVPVLVRNRAGFSCHTHRHHPFDVVGWDGHLYPWAFNIADFEPIVGPHPPAAPGPPDLRGPRLRRVLLRPAPLRLPPGCDQGPVPPRQHRQRRGPLLLGR